MPVAERQRKVYYRSHDNRPMGETDLHRDLMMYLIEALRDFYSARPDVYVAGNNFLYYEEGRPSACVSPDTYVVFGVSKHQRDIYKTWEEMGRLPDVVVEVTSRKTRRHDQQVKFPRYERLGIRELYFFDPTGDYLKPRFQGYHLHEGAYVRANVGGIRAHSPALGLDLIPAGTLLRLYDPANDYWLPTREELRGQIRQQESLLIHEREARAVEEQRRLDEEKRRQDEETRRLEAEVEIERLRLELRRLRGE
jgi:Uma2 family endonuclease